MILLTTPVTAIHMVGSIYGKKLERLDIKTVKDLLYHIPSRYLDFSKTTAIKNALVGDVVTISGTISSFFNIPTKRQLTIQKIILQDETDSITCIWYNQPFLRNILKKGIKLAVAGSIQSFQYKRTFVSPEYEIFNESKNIYRDGNQSTPIHTGRLVPIYPETEGVSSKWLRRRIHSILTYYSPKIDEFIPHDILNQFSLIPEQKAIYDIHFPSDMTCVDKSKRRLEFSELFLFHLASEMKKEKLSHTNGPLFRVTRFQSSLDTCIQTLPFKLTPDQTFAISDILKDFEKKTPMNRLLVGDVGCGKTVVAAIALYCAYLNGYQSAFMSPTEILAQQHFHTISGLLSPLGVSVRCVTGHTKQDGCFDIAIGTHALLSKKMRFDNLGFVVIDEQQRFGVDQRLSLYKKGAYPHLLSMTATPIPRTVALTYFTDLNVSYIDELPKGRKKIKTWIVPPQKRDKAYEWINVQLDASSTKEQLYVICPFIDASETLESVRSAIEEYKKLQKVFAHKNVAMLHGRMEEKTKTSVLTRFCEGLIDVLVATPIVEIGIDAPFATYMIIEGSERFGLAQLHQLRGRIGRSNQQSYCFLFTSSSSTKTTERLHALIQTQSGSKLAEIDLKQRGPGEFFGNKQHGLSQFKFTDFSDKQLIKQSKEAALFYLAKMKGMKLPIVLQNRIKPYTMQMVMND